VELYLERRDKGEGPVRLDTAEVVEVPAALAEERDVSGGLTIRLSERPGSSMLERVVVETTPQRFVSDKMLKADLAKGALPRTERNIVGRDGGPSLLAPVAGRKQLITPTESLLPKDLVRGQSFITMMKICVTTEGSTEAVTFLRSPGRALEGDLAAAIRKWQYRPYLVNGQPVPFCYPTRLEVRQGS
jgi:hypothetical protein